MRRSSFIRRAGRHPEDGLKSRLIRYAKRAGIGALILWAGAWLWLSGFVDQAREWGRAETVVALGSAGFKVKNIFVEGRNHVDADLIKALVNMEKDDPIFAFDPSTVQAMLQTVPWVRAARVERRLPDTIYISLEERKPFALWSRDGKLGLIAEDGTLLSEANLAEYQNFLILTGTNAPQKASDLITLLSAQPDIKQRLESASWVGDRRWDLLLKCGTIVRLPEEDTALALSRLVDAHKKDGLMDTALQTIDLREQSRIVVRAREEKLESSLRELTSTRAHSSPAAGDM